MQTTEIHFRDPRPPQEIQFELERMFRQLFRATAGARLTYTMDHRRNGVSFSVRLQFVAALATANAYYLHIEAAQPGASVPGWLQFFTRDFAAAKPPAARENLTGRYAELVRAALEAEAHLPDVPAIQQEILERMKQGQVFSNAHKEGGTQIRYFRREYEREGRFERSSYGESNETVRYPSEADFLAALRIYFDSEVSGHCYPAQPDDVVAWKLILRMLYKPQQ